MVTPCLPARPVVLPEKDEETLAAEAEAEERARRVVKLKTDLEEAEEKTKKWGERAVRLTAALAGSCVITASSSGFFFLHPTGQSRLSRIQHQFREPFASNVWQYMNRVACICICCTSVISHPKSGV